MASPSRRIAILAEGQFVPFEAKTAIGLLRYRPEDVVAVIDSRRAGATTHECVGTGGEIPVVAGVAAAQALGANTLVIGIAPAGGRLPLEWRPILEAALDQGWRIVSGMHTFLGDDPELGARAAAHGGALEDVRRPPRDIRIGLKRAAQLDALVVLTVGTDCNVGKMTASLEVQRALRARGARASFVATGQTGIMIAGRGVAMDAVPADFLAGAIESHVLEAAVDHDIVIVEGQGSLHHPAYSGVSLGLLHGCCPSALILCHHLGRERMRIGSDTEADGPPLPTLEAAAESARAAAAWVHPARLAAVALNTWGSSEPQAREACAAAQRSLQVPVSDPIRFGSGPIADALLALRAERAAVRLS